MTKTIETYIVDSFTSEPFKGNPAGVCVLETDLQDEQMLSVAKELGLSETAFIRKSGETNEYTIRYFSPKMEIPLCGHATLASAKVLFERDTAMTNIHFFTIQHLDLVIHRSGANIVMEFPLYDTQPQAAPVELLRALGIETIVNSAYNKEMGILLLEIESSQMLVDLSPDYERLKRSHNSINGVLVTATSQRPGYDFESRYFWPWSGTNEDPVTGATHTFLAKYWSERLNKEKMNAYQCSTRSGFMEVELISNNILAIKSMAKIVLQGELRI